jgi:hypothetical protein
MRTVDYLPPLPTDQLALNQKLIPNPELVALRYIVNLIFFDIWVHMGIR